MQKGFRLDALGIAYLSEGEHIRRHNDETIVSRSVLDGCQLDADQNQTGLSLGE